MNGMTESYLVQHINAQCHPVLIYRHKLSGVRYLVTYTSSHGYELNPIHSQSRHASLKELDNSDVWQRLS
ncbi:MAG TPA: hypothetical protein VLC30_13475 [Pseudomonas sp.]|nr:hypothetical protein [Pseudomonas sp.]